MTEVAPNNRGVFRTLSMLSRKKSTSRKLVKRALMNDEATNKDIDRRSSWSNREKKPKPFLDRSDSISEQVSIFNLSRRRSQSSQNASAPKQTPRKLSKNKPPEKKTMVLDKDTGERKDLTDMLHAFSYNEATDGAEDDDFELVLQEYDPLRPDGAQLAARLSPELWDVIGDFLSPLDIANLSSTCQTIYSYMGERVNRILRDPINRSHRQSFLLAMDEKVPDYLFCFPCLQWHIRTQPGSESLKPTAILNPLFRCPNSENNLCPPPRLRISEGRALPFAFVQLAKRQWTHGSAYGIPVQSLARRWKDTTNPDWTHESKYHIHTNGHVLMRVKSQTFVEGGMAPAAKRLLLYSRGDYTPYFSVCAHWKKGLLTSIPKCALDHIPMQKTSAITQLRMQKACGPVTLCGKCQPMRRCPKCPTEYLFELKLVEDKSSRMCGPERFRQALLVTRWSDLGPARSPDDREWAAIVGELGGYDSFIEIGRRAISGVFESAFTDTIPGHRILSINPNEKDEVGDESDWY